MYLVTCHQKDCPTPQFYVDPIAGKILLSAAADLSEMKLAVSSGKEATLTKLNELMSSVNKEIKNLTEEENEKLIRKFIEFLSSQQSEGLPKVTKINEVVDYLVVRCQSNHKNYLAISDDKEIV